MLSPAQLVGFTLAKKTQNDPIYSLEQQSRLFYVETLSDPFRFYEE